MGCHGIVLRGGVTVMGGGGNGAGGVGGRLIWKCGGGWPIGGGGGVARL